ncbi:hypothetical protein PIIN_04303 [Serendipita indica DSM 11827]|uniref:pH-response transcription factor pacC/RIM101 n=1 Tax=Serendipita indica (strain DSM 11827) TaxID=1109443 RepID=G4TGB5_SERID|nr:hypothetical protein PIIN_04303 [Serendipita indica DSM 11827]
MDPNHPNHALARTSQRRDSAAQLPAVRQVSPTIGQPGHWSAQISHATMHAGGPSTIDGAHPSRPFHYALPQGHPHGRMHGSVPPTPLYYPVPGHATNSPVQIPSNPPPSTAPTSGSPASPMQPAVLSSDQQYLQWSAQGLPGAMRSISAVRDEREGYQYPVEVAAPSAAATGSDVGAIRQQRHHSLGNEPYSLYPPQHQQLHRRVASLQHPYAPTETTAFVSYDGSSQSQQDLQRQAYIQPRPSYPLPGPHQWSPHTPPTSTSFQVDMLARQQRRGSFGQFAHSLPSSAIPSPTQAAPSPSATYRFLGREGMNMRERSDSIAPPPTASSSSSSVASGMVHPAARMALAHPELSPSGVPLDYNLQSSALLQGTESPALGISTGPTQELPTEAADEPDSNAQAAKTTTGGGRREKRKDSRPHKCPTCAKGFPRPSALETHMTVHSGAKPYPCPIKTCNKSFAVRSNARRHLKTHGIKIKTRERRSLATTDASTSLTKGKGRKGGSSLNKERVYEDEERDTSPNNDDNDDGLESEEDGDERVGLQPIASTSRAAVHSHSTAAQYNLPLLADSTTPSTSAHAQSAYKATSWGGTQTTSVALTRPTTRSSAFRSAPHRGHGSVLTDDPLGLAGTVEIVRQEFDVLQPPPPSLVTTGSLQSSNPSANPDTYPISLDHNEATLRGEDGGDETTTRKAVRPGADRSTAAERRTSRRRESGKGSETSTSIATGGSTGGGGGHALRAQREATASARRTRGASAASSHRAPVSRPDVASSHTVGAEDSPETGVRLPADATSVHPSSLEAIEVINQYSSASHGRNGDDRPYDIEVQVEGDWGGSEGVLNDLSESALRNLYSSRREPDPASVARAVPSSGEIILPAMDQTALDKLIAPPTRWKTFERQKLMRERLNEELDGVAAANYTTIAAPGTTTLSVGGVSGVLDRMLEYAHADQAGILPPRMVDYPVVGGPHPYTNTAVSWPASSLTRSVAALSASMDLTPPALVGTSSSFPDTHDVFSISAPECFNGPAHAEEAFGGYIRTDGTRVPHSMSLFKNVDALKNSPPFDLLNLSTVALGVPLPAVQPKTPAFPGDKAEERDSFSPTIGSNPYQNDQFVLRPVLPGPAPHVNAASHFALKSASIHKRPSSARLVVA